MEFAYSEMLRANCHVFSWMLTRYLDEDPRMQCKINEAARIVASNDYDADEKDAAVDRLLKWLVSPDAPKACAVV